MQRVVCRLDIGEGNYAKELEEDYEISDEISALQELVIGNESTCAAFRQQFLDYSYLWTQDLNSTLEAKKADDRFSLENTMCRRFSKNVLNA